MRKLIYICGPPCTGKSAVANELMRVKDNAMYLGGDAFMRQPNNRDFPEKILLVARCLIVSVREILRSSDGDLIVEWVPNTGAFPEELRIAAQGLARFSQYTLIASQSALDSRKLARDGDTYDSTFLLDSIGKDSSLVVFDTEAMTTGEIAARILGRA